jgi:predicted alpha/beta superfamily hydrolase
MNKFKVIITIIITLLSIKGGTQSNPNPEGEITIGKVDSLYSDILQEQRKIWIHVPEGKDSTIHYPVIYLLDASEHFHVVTGMLKQLTKWKMPESIVVGIMNTDRIRDFTPTNISFSRGHNTETSGGANSFIKFLDKELQPYINNKYQTENNNTIIGHSTAGLFVLYSYLHNVESFDNYLAVEPSLWWDKENLVKESKELLNKINRKGKSLYVAVANSLGDKMDTIKVRKDRSEPTEQIRANLNFHDILVKNNKTINYTWEYFKSEDHGSVTIPALYNGLRSIFSWFPFPELWRFNTPRKYNAKELITPFYNHYEKLSAHMKRDLKPDWDLVNDIASFMLEGHNLPKKCLAYLEMNAKFYPSYSKSYVALGNYHLSQKDKSEAIRSYKKAVEVDGNEDAKAKLKELN